jgi:hypothetical protein
LHADPHPLSLNTPPPPPSQLHAYVGGVLAFVLVFRSNGAYDRFVFFFWFCARDHLNLAKQQQQLTTDTDIDTGTDTDRYYEARKTLGLITNQCREIILEVRGWEGVGGEVVLRVCKL